MMRDEPVRSTKGIKDTKEGVRALSSRGWLKQTGIRREKNTGRGLYRRKRKKEEETGDIVSMLVWKRRR
jgi:hypothetical protein